MQDTDVLLNQIYCYEQKHRYTTGRCRSANDQLYYRHLLAYLKYNETKTSDLRIPVPSSLHNMVDNLQWKDYLTYLDTHSRLLEPSGFSALSYNSKALNACSHEVTKFNIKQKNFEKPHPNCYGKTEPSKCNQASYCKKHNHPHEGHTLKFGDRLMSARDNWTRSARPPAPSSDIVAYRAILTVHEQ